MRLFQKVQRNLKARAFSRALFARGEFLLNEGSALFIVHLPFADQCVQPVLPRSFYTSSLGTTVLPRPNVECSEGISAALMTQRGTGVIWRVLKGRR